MNQNPLEMGWLVDSIKRIATDLDDVNAFEEAVIALCQQSSREIYVGAFAWLQEQWLEANRDDFVTVRWRSIRQVTPFGEIELPVLVVRRREAKRGGYLSLSKVLFQPKATRLLSPAMERKALLCATEMNYRPAARNLSQPGGGSAVSHWLVWPCAWPMARFGPAARRMRDHHYGFEVEGIVMSDGDEGLERMRERVFAGEPWLLDRWHVDKRLKGLCGEDTAALGRMRRALYRADSEELLAEMAAVRTEVDA